MAARSSARLEAAIAEFSQHGFQGASTQAIAERAQLKKSQLHYYIEDKEALYSQVLGMVLDSWRSFFVFDAEPELTPREALSEFVRVKLDYALEQPELSRIFTMEVLSGGARLKGGGVMTPAAACGTALVFASVSYASSPI